MMKKTLQTSNIQQKGAVSLFIVIFTSLLVTTITVSFMQLMVRDQQQAMNSDLSESAYDSAVAGVEDGKRALLLNQECIGNTSQRCNDIRAAIAAGECTTLSTISNYLGGTAATNGETEIRQSNNDRRLQQAYTCVKIKTLTEDYLGNFDSANVVDVLPLRSNGEFDRIIISWSQSENGGAVNLPANGDISLPNSGSTTWPQDRPSLLKAQLINGSGHTEFTLSDLDSSTYSNTLFLHPSRVGLTSLEFSTDGRRGGINGEPQRVECEPSVSSGAYACSVEIATTGMITPSTSEKVYLALAAFYNPTSYKIELRDSRAADPDDRVSFSGVQPEIDSTGRANDLFRRVVSRVELGNTFTYPIAALETSGNLCKNFSVTTETSGYVNNCTP